MVRKVLKVRLENAKCPNIGACIIEKSVKK